jgi:hypothetical protein
VCAAAAGGVLTSFGIATIGIEPWFVPVLVILLLVGLWGFWQSARNHRKIWPFVIAAISSSAVVAGRLFEIPLVLWGAAAGISVAYAFDWRLKKMNR